MADGTPPPSNPNPLVVPANIAPGSQQWVDYLNDVISTERQGVVDQAVGAGMVYGNQGLQAALNSLSRQGVNVYTPRAQEALVALGDFFRQVGATTYSESHPNESKYATTYVPTDPSNPGLGGTYVPYGSVKQSVSMQGPRPSSAPAPIQTPTDYIQPLKGSGADWSPVLANPANPSQTIPLSTIAPNLNANGGIRSGSISGMSEDTQRKYLENLGETTVYTPEGNYINKEIPNAKIAISAAGELGIYPRLGLNPAGEQRMSVNPDTGKLEPYTLIGGGGRNALQSGGFSLAAQSKAVVEQGTLKFIEPQFITPQAASSPYSAAQIVEMAKSGLPYYEIPMSRLGAELYGGAAGIPLDNRTVQNTGIEYGMFPESSQNLALLVNPYAVNVGKAALPGANIPWSLPEEAPTVSVVNEYGLTGKGVNLPQRPVRDTIYDRSMEGKTLFDVTPSTKLSEVVSNTQVESRENAPVEPMFTPTNKLTGEPGSAAIPVSTIVPNEIGGEVPAQKGIVDTLPKPFMSGNAPQQQNNQDVFSGISSLLAGTPAGKVITGQSTIQEESLKAFPLAQKQSPDKAFVESAGTFLSGLIPESKVQEAADILKRSNAQPGGIALSATPLGAEGGLAKLGLQLSQTEILKGGGAAIAALGTLKLKEIYEEGMPASIPGQGFGQRLSDVPESKSFGIPGAGIDIQADLPGMGRNIITSLPTAGSAILIKTSEAIEVPFASIISMPKPSISPEDITGFTPVIVGSVGNAAKDTFMAVDRPIFDLSVQLNKGSTDVISKAQEVYANANQPSATRVQDSSLFAPAAGVFSTPTAQSNSLVTPNSLSLPSTSIIPSVSNANPTRPENTFTPQVIPAFDTISGSGSRAPPQKIEFRRLPDIPDLRNSSGGGIAYPSGKRSRSFTEVFRVGEGIGQISLIPRSIQSGKQQKKTIQPKSPKIEGFNVAFRKQSSGKRKRIF